ncbi:MAG: hypothetical protein COB23_08985 [Methylophaga sp.]|nr:MAG: hypothetical protein COB23_08985 [Methylophaga sp.]
MKTINFPFIAVALGLMLMLVVVRGSQIGEDGTTTLPLLTLLVVSEFCFFVNAIGAYIGIKHMYATSIKPAYAAVTVVCVILAARFMWLGITLWPL